MICSNKPQPIHIFSKSDEGVIFEFDYSGLIPAGESPTFVLLQLGYHSITGQYNPWANFYIGNQSDLSDATLITYIYEGFGFVFPVSPNKKLYFKAENINSDFEKAGLYWAGFTDVIQPINKSVDLTYKSGEKREFDLAQLLGIDDLGVLVLGNYLYDVGGFYLPSSPDISLGWVSETYPLMLLPTDKGKILIEGIFNSETTHTLSIIGYIPYQNFLPHPVNVPYILNNAKFNVSSATGINRYQTDCEFVLTGRNGSNYFYAWNSPYDTSDDDTIYKSPFGIRASCPLLENGDLHLYVRNVDDNSNVGLWLIAGTVYNRAVREVIRPQYETITITANSARPVAAAKAEILNIGVDNAFVSATGQADVIVPAQSLSVVIDAKTAKYVKNTQVDTSTLTLAANFSAVAVKTAAKISPPLASVEVRGWTPIKDCLRTYPYLIRHYKQADDTQYTFDYSELLPEGKSAKAILLRIFADLPYPYCCGVNSAIGDGTYSGVYNFSVRLNGEWKTICGQYIDGGTRVIIPAGDDNSFQYQLGLNDIQDLDVRLYIDGFICDDIIHVFDEPIKVYIPNQSGVLIDFNKKIPSDNDVGLLLVSEVSWIREIYFPDDYPNTTVIKRRTNTLEEQGDVYTYVWEHVYGAGFVEGSLIPTKNGKIKAKLSEDGFAQTYYYIEVWGYIKKEFYIPSVFSWGGELGNDFQTLELSNSLEIQRYFEDLIGAVWSYGEGYCQVYGGYLWDDRVDDKYKNITIAPQGSTIIKGRNTGDGFYVSYRKGSDRHYIVAGFIYDRPVITWAEQKATANINIRLRPVYINNSGNVVAAPLFQSDVAVKTLTATVKTGAGAAAESCPTSISLATPAVVVEQHFPIEPFALNLDITVKTPKVNWKKIIFQNSLYVIKEFSTADEGVIFEFDYSGLFPTTPPDDFPENNEYNWLLLYTGFNGGVDWTWGNLYIGNQPDLSDAIVFNSIGNGFKFVFPVSPNKKLYFKGENINPDAYRLFFMLGGFLTGFIKRIPEQTITITSSGGQVKYHDFRELLGYDDIGFILIKNEPSYISGIYDLDGRQIGAWNDLTPYSFLPTDAGRIGIKNGGTTQITIIGYIPYQYIRNAAAVINDKYSNTRVDLQQYLGDVPLQNFAGLFAGYSWDDRAYLWKSPSDTSGSPDIEGMPYGIGIMAAEPSGSALYSYIVNSSWSSDGTNQIGIQGILYEKPVRAVILQDILNLEIAALSAIIVISGEADTTPLPASLSISVNAANITTINNQTITASAISISADVNNVIVGTSQTVKTQVVNLTATVNSVSIKTSTTANPAPETLNIATMSAGFVAIRNITITTTASGLFINENAANIKTSNDTNIQTATNSLNISVNSAIIVAVSNISIAATASSLNIAANSPTVHLSNTINAAANTLNVSVNNVSIAAIQNKTVQAVANALSANVNAASITAIENIIISATSAAINTAVNSPAISAGGNITITTAANSLSVNVNSPAITTNNALAPERSQLSILQKAAAIAAGFAVLTASSALNTNVNSPAITAGVSVKTTPAASGLAVSPGTSNVLTGVLIKPPASGINIYVKNPANISLVVEPTPAAAIISANSPAIFAQKRFETIQAYNSSLDISVLNPARLGEFKEGLTKFKTSAYDRYKIKIAYY